MAYHSFGTRAYCQLKQRTPEKKSISIQTFPSNLRLRLLYGHTNCVVQQHDGRISHLQFPPWWVFPAGHQFAHPMARWGHGKGNLQPRSRSDASRWRDSRTTPSSRTSEKNLHVFSGQPVYNTLRPRQNGRNFAPDISTHIFVNENVVFRFSLKFSRTIVHIMV